MITSSIPITPIPAQPQRTSHQAPLTVLEVERAADEAIQILCEKWACADDERNELLVAAIALIEALDRTCLIKTWVEDELEQLRAAIVGLTESIQ